MNKNVLVLMLMSLFVTPVMADKPEWAGKGKPTAEQKAAHKAAMEAKDDLEESEDRIKESKEKAHKLKEGEDRIKENKGKAHQLKDDVKKKKHDKSEQLQKELDKGSDKGKASREANSKKWWKFWGE